MKLTSFIEALRNGEEFLLRSVITYAAQAEYTQYTSTREEEWRLTVREPARLLIEYLKSNHRPEAIHVDEDFAANPSAAFGVLEAKLHRARGVRFDMFLGLTKLLRQSFVDLVYATEMSLEETKLALAVTHRFFDKFELGFATEWLRDSEMEKLQELQEANRRLTNENNRYLTIFQSMAEPAFVVDPEMRLVEANTAFLHFFGLHKDDWRGKKCFETINYGLCPDCPLQRAIRECSSFHLIEAVLKSPAGDRQVLMSGSFLDDISGKYSGGVAILQDVTDRKKKEEAIWRAKREWELTFDAVTDSIALIDRKYRILRLNRSMAKVLGLSPDEAVGRLCYEIVHGSKAPPAYCPHAALMADGREHQAEVREERLGGDFLVTTSPLLDDRGVLIGSVHVARDITEQKKLEVQLRQSQKMEAIGTLAGGIAHDFNNILGAIIGYTQLSMLDTLEGSILRKNLRQVLAASNRASNLVKQILTFSRQRESERQPIRLSSIIAEAIRLLRASLPSTIEIRHGLSSTKAAVVADPTQMHQVLMNLCSNAAHAMRDKGGILEISLAETFLDEAEVMRYGMTPGPYVRLTVGDTGHGIDPAVMDRIFDPFFTTKETGQGTGMGLAVVHGIVKTHGGNISVRSKVGQGTVFEVLLPRSEMDGAAPPEDQWAPRTRSSRVRVLLVDDEQPLVDICAQMLDRLNCVVEARTSSLEALAVFQARPRDFDLVITDQTMPKMTGIDLTIELLSQRPDLPVILCTGYSEFQLASVAEAAGVKAVLKKPLTMLDLARAVDEVLGRNGPTTSAGSA
ncbi:MAG: PAS domain-containing protein [Thermodesulfobacteriota bacterium]